jgi:uncharacterized protein
MVTEEQLQEIVRRIVEGYAPDRIILFGSYAYGTPTEESDVDLLVIKADDERAKHLRLGDVSHSLWHADPANLPEVDILVLNQPEQERVLQNRFVVENKALRNGRILYNRAA